MIGKGVGEKGRDRRGKKGHRGVEREKGKNVLPYCQKAASTVEFFWWSTCKTPAQYLTITAQVHLFLSLERYSYSAVY